MRATHRNLSTQDLPPQPFFQTPEQRAVFAELQRYCAVIVVSKPAARLGLQAPRSWELTNTAINRLLWTPEGLSLVGWADIGHLQDDADAPLDESTT